MLRWDVGNTGEGASIAAASVHRLDVRHRMDWAEHTEMDGPLFVSTEFKSVGGETDPGSAAHVVVLKPSDDDSPANELKSRDGFRAPRWCVFSGIPFDPSGAYFVAERDGLRVFRSDTLDSVREIQQTPAMAQFDAERPSELDNHNSSCFLIFDAGLFVRIAKIYRFQTDPCEYSVAIVYDFVHDTVRDIDLRIDDRTDVHGVDWADGRLWFYLVTATVGKNASDGPSDTVWTHIVTDERHEHLYRELADGSSDPLLWDSKHGWLMRSIGYTANPQPLPLTTEICVFDYRAATKRTFRVEFRDSRGRPGLFGGPIDTSGKR